MNGREDEPLVPLSFFSQWASTAPPTAPLPPPPPPALQKILKNRKATTPSRSSRLGALPRHKCIYSALKI